MEESMDNEILEEIWKARKEIEDAAQGDLKVVFLEMKKKTNESPRKQYAGEEKKTAATKNA
jgi:hypothetical protein